MQFNFSTVNNNNSAQNINVSHGFDTFGQDYNGWSNSCFTCIMMRTVSIAQKGDNMNSGSLFGTVSWNYSVLEQGSNFSIPWDATTNQECINYPGWYDYYNATQECSAGPPSGAVSTNIQVYWTDYANQDVNIRTY
ncbi:MAG: hypothetical protein M3169_01970 [Candidatus Eremiobacteraeota bacterium]|nr:hypothetical protein [Candidatus Eremiobacteraeota bacterium]